MGIKWGVTLGQGNGRDWPQCQQRQLWRPMAAVIWNATTNSGYGYNIAWHRAR